MYKYTPFVHAREEQYGDYLARLFPKESYEDKGMHINGKHCKNITFQVTEDCNLCCTYCYQTHKSKNHMSFDTAKKFIDMILASDYRSNQYITADKSVGVIIEFIGGEPFLEVDLMDQIMEYFLETTYKMHHRWATRYRISISSNGLLYFTPKVQNFIKKYKRNLSISISVDGNKELHDSCRLKPDGSGSYDDAIAAVKHYTEVLGGSMGSKMTIAPGNITHVKDAVLSLLDNNYDIIHLNCVYEEGWNNDYAKELYKQLKDLTDTIMYSDRVYDYKEISMFNEFSGCPMDESDNQNWCGGNGLMISVDWRGDIYPCIRYMDSSLNGEQPAYPIGNVDVGIMQTKEDCDRVHCLGCITRRSQSTDECFYCPIARSCSWCTAYNYQVFGTPDKRATFICPMHKAEILANVYYWNTLYKLTGQKKVYEMNVPKEWALEIIDEDEYNMLCAMSEEGKSNGYHIVNNSGTYPGA